MPNNDWNIEFVNENLKYYLDKDEYKEYSTLIKEVLRDDIAPGAKWNLYTLLMNHGTSRLAEQNLAKALRTVYCSDPNINEYVKNAVRFNPLLGYVSIHSKSGLDMKHNYSLDIQIKVPYDSDSSKHFENVENIMARCREVLTMMLMEAKTIPYAKIDSEKSKA